MLLLLLVLLPQAAQARTMAEAGQTEAGILYVDTDSAQSLTKEGQLYLAVAAEEVYTDAVFLASLRQEPELARAAGMVYLYLFNQYGSAYVVAARYLVDDKGQVCLNLGSNWQLQQTEGNKTMLNAYTKALQAWEARRRWRSTPSAK